jgi:arylsulfatase A
MACVHAFDCLLLFLLTIQGAGGKNTTTSLPNIIVFLVDDLGYGDLGFTGHPSTRTPELDRLAAEGRRLTNWYTGYPVCSASRTALLTGRQPPRVGMVGVLNSLSKVGLPLSETTVADALRDRAGYATLALGKWHQGQLPAYLPTARGFDEFYGLPFSVDDGVGYVSSCGAGDKDVEEEDKRLLATVAKYDLGLGPSLPLPKLRQVNGTNVIEQQPTDLTPLTAGLVNSTVDFLRRQRTEQPVFVWFAFGHVHTTGLEDQMQYSGCGWAGATPRGAFGDGLAEVDGVS